MKNVSKRILLVGSMFLMVGGISQPLNAGFWDNMPSFFRKGLAIAGAVYALTGIPKIGKRPVRTLTRIAIGSAIAIGAACWDFVSSQSEVPATTLVNSDKQPQQNNTNQANQQAQTQSTVQGAYSYVMSPITTRVSSWWGSARAMWRGISQVANMAKKLGNDQPQQQQATATATAAHE